MRGSRSADSLLFGSGDSDLPPTVPARTRHSAMADDQSSLAEAAPRLPRRSMSLDFNLAGEDKSTPPTSSSVGTVGTVPAGGIAPAPALPKRKTSADFAEVTIAPGAARPQLPPRVTEAGAEGAEDDNSYKRKTASALGRALGSSKDVPSGVPPPVAAKLKASGRRRSVMVSAASRELKFIDPATGSPPRSGFCENLLTTVGDIRIYIPH